MKKTTKKTDEVVCRLIPLYKFTIYYDEDVNEPYTFHVVSDSIGGLVEGIVKREIAFSMKECRKYLDVDDFLLMPCDQAKKGYHLFDIDNADCVGCGNNIDETWYSCHFKGDVPEPVTGYGEAIEEIMSDLKKLHKNNDDCHDDIIGRGEFHISELSGILGESLYKSEEVRKGVSFKNKKINEHVEREIRICEDALTTMRRNTG